MANRLPGPTMDEVPGDVPAPGITRVDLTSGGFGAMKGTSVPESMANSGMDTSYTTEGRRRSLTPPNSK